MKEQTNYRGQKNRCTQCGHRISMHYKHVGACNVETKEAVCTCKRVRE